MNVSSMLGLVGLAERPAYTAAKGGVIQLTRTLAAEWAPHNLLVNAIAPGPFATEMNRPLLENPTAYRAFADKIPLNRWGKPAELAGAIVFLASEASSFMTGAVLTIDGGWTAQ
ncbi:MAG TPA: SDR family oxidoreductase [Chthoniobacterales bacterium]|nr:SDR family oxidoreductase [Chthoniobacterales bacterium]